MFREKVVQTYLRDVPGILGSLRQIRKKSKWIEFPYVHPFKLHTAFSVTQFSTLHKQKIKSFFEQTGINSTVENQKLN